MRILIQNVLKAAVRIDEKTVAKIDKGYLLFIGFKEGDNEEIATKLVDKLLSLRILPDENGKTNLSIKDIDGDILSVSQFTLYANTNEGRRPSFTNCLKPSLALPLWEYTNSLLARANPKFQKGVFGADMKVELINDGPFTIMLDSEALK